MLYAFTHMFRNWWIVAVRGALAAARDWLTG